MSKWWVAGPTFSHIHTHNVAPLTHNAVGPYLPWGVHLAYGEDTSRVMQVMWSTRSAVAGSVAYVGSAPGNWSATYAGAASNFTDVSNTQFIHYVVMTGLAPGTVYYYAVGDGAGNTSAAFHFRTYPANPVPTTFAIFADMGVDVNAQGTVPYLAADAASGAIDIVLHVGDIAYDLDSNNGGNGDAFVVAAQSYAAYVPEHVTVGNHEAEMEGNADFVQYIGRFNMMPGNATSDSMYHSFNAGLTHVVMLSSEVYFYLSTHGLDLMPTQYAWLEDDLAGVNRSVTPWLLTMGHRPMYCSPDDDEDDCHQLLSVVRDGIAGYYGLEPLIYKYGVDIHIGGHEHNYEFNRPVYQFMWNQSLTPEQALIDYDRPIHILSGAAGCPENQDAWQTAGNPFSLVRLNVYGYGRLHVLNATTAVWEFLDVTNNTIVDTRTIVQHNHGPYSGLQDVPLATRREALTATLDHLKHTATGHHNTHRHNYMPGHVHDTHRRRHELDSYALRLLATDNMARLGMDMP